MVDTLRNTQTLVGTSVGPGEKNPLVNTQAATPKSWPFEEAQKVAARLAASGKTEALFETGYGPSGLPHIGTFMEVARTGWVRHAFGALTGLPSRLLAFSDDMDGLRKVPTNVPNQEMLAEFISMPLTRVPDPFGTHESFGAHNNAELRRFLDGFGFDYEFASSTDYYTSGRFDPALLKLLSLHEQIVSVILPTLGSERAATYSPFLPIHPRTGRVMQVRIDETRTGSGTIVWQDPETSERFETPVTGGAVKLQWKADWAMRWSALGVDYEMSGKDLIDSVRLSGKICRILGSAPPENLTYELFLDETGQKISKSKGNGLGVDEWLRYAPPESLGQFMFNQPQRAKRLFFDVIPKAVDEYLANAAKARTQDAEAQKTNAAWHINAGHVPETATSPLSFTMLLNLASVVNAHNSDILWGFIRRYSPGATPEQMPFLATLVDRAVAYYVDFVGAAKRFRQPDDTERAALTELAAALRLMPEGSSAEDIQNILYDIGKRHPFPELRAWFSCLYQVLLGQQEGPRFGQFVALYGVAETVALIEAALSRAFEPV